MANLVSFTNCYLALEDGSLHKQDLWIDSTRGVILDAQKTFFTKRLRPATVIDLDGLILSPGLIDIQINGAYDFDFSIYEDDDAYRAGLLNVAERITETGVTSIVPTLITQESSLYPKLLSLLRPFHTATSATLLGWHAEGPFLEMEKRGAHAPPFLRTAPEGFKSFEGLYGAPNLADKEDWLMEDDGSLGVRIITAAPEIEGVMDAIPELTKRGVVFSIGHSVATSQTATRAVRHGANLITHLFNAMPQLHHRDPSIIGLLGASPYLATPFASEQIVAPNASTVPPTPAVEKPQPLLPADAESKSEAFDTSQAGPQSPKRKQGSESAASMTPTTTKKQFDRPFYEMIVDGIHSHPNSVRLAYTSHPAGCILITDAMKILDPNLKDGLHPWRDGKNFIKEGDKLYLEGTNTLAGSCVTLDKCVRNFWKFTGCTLGEALKCATLNPAKCLGIEKRKGTLRPGADADLIVMDWEGNVRRTWVRGKEVWTQRAP